MKMRMQSMKYLFSMRWFRGIVTVLLLATNLPAHAFTTVDEQIGHYLKILDSGSYAAKFQMLERLQWSGISDPRLYYRIDTQVQFQGMLNIKQIGTERKELLSHQIRALGYSGDQRYRNTLGNIKKHAKSQKLRRHAKKALSQLDQFGYWNKLIADSNFRIEEKSIEVTTYMKMLSTDHVMVQRLAARAIFHERRTDADLISLVAEKLEGLYLQSGLDGEAQDAAAWLCKALGQSGQTPYLELLKLVAADTPYAKIKRHAAKSVSGFGQGESKESIFSSLTDVSILTEEQLLNDIVGNTLTGSKGTWTWADYYEPSQSGEKMGKIRGKSDKPYSGRWKIAGSLMCFNYEGSSSGDGCWTLARDGNTITWYKTNSEKEELWPPSKLVPGNPNNF